MRPSLPTHSQAPPLHLTAYVVLALLIVLLALLPDSWQHALQYQRTDISNNQYWRVFSGHLLHSNTWHLVMNLAGLLLATLLHGSYYRPTALVLQWLLCTLIISLALYHYSPQIHIYVGLSGLLHAMLTLGALKDIQLKLSTGWLLLAALIGKITWEQWQGPNPELAELINANVAIDAHLYGVCSGFSLGLLLYIRQRRSGAA